MVVCLAGTHSFCHNGCFKLRNDANEFWPSYSPSLKELRPVPVHLFHLHPSLPHFFAHGHGQYRSRRIFSETGQNKLAISEFLGNIGVGCIEATHISYRPIHEQTSIKRSEEPRCQLGKCVYIQIKVSYTQRTHKCQH